MAVSHLTHQALSDLAVIQTQVNRYQGVYVVHYRNEPVYVGKAHNISQRLSDHLFKLSGRQNIDLQFVGFQALYLDQSMSTAANEDLLIAQYKSMSTGMWNGAGFGTKDPGRQRDTTKPNGFDLGYPINAHYLVTCEIASDQSILLNDLLANMKAQLPYVFRYGPLGDAGQRRIVLPTSQLTAHSILQTVVHFLGGSWHAAILSYGMVLYNESKQYSYATVLHP